VAHLTLKELAAEYRQGAQLLAGRIRELAARRSRTHDRTEQLVLEGRMAPLIEMRRQAQLTARDCERYYNTGGVCRGKTTLPPG